MNFSRQALLGIGMIIGGSVMLYAMVQQIGDSNEPQPASAMVDKPSPEQESPQPLTTDIETEKRILAEKQKERAARVAEQEKRAQQFLTEQEAAEAEALAKARAESQQYMASSAAAAEESDKSDAEKNDATTPIKKTSAAESAESETNTGDQQKAAQAQQEAQRQAAIKEQAAAKKLADSKKEAEAKRQADVKKQADAAAEKKQAAAEAAKNEPPKSPSDYQVKRGDGLIKLARQYNMPVEVLAQANNLSPSTSLQLGQSLTIPSRKQVERLAREAAAAEQAREDKRQKEEALAKSKEQAVRLAENF